MVNSLGKKINQDSNMILFHNYSIIDIYDC